MINVQIRGVPEKYTFAGLGVISSVGNQQLGLSVASLIDMCQGRFSDGHVLIG